MKTGAVVLMALVLAACSKSSTSSTSSNPTGPTTSDTTISFASQVQPIFSSNCALSGCHSGSGAQQGMNLAAGSAYAAIVNVPSREKSQFMRVLPSKSDSSYLYLKITGSSLISGARMPYNRPALSQSDIQTIQSWIDQGAKNN
jgi:hypothetical protein